VIAGSNPNKSLTCVYSHAGMARIESRLRMQGAGNRRHVPAGASPHPDVDRQRWSCRLL